MYSHYYFALNVRAHPFEGCMTQFSFTLTQRGTCAHSTPLVPHADPSSLAVHFTDFCVDCSTLIPFNIPFSPTLIPQMSLSPFLKCYYLSIYHLIGTIMALQEIFCFRLLWFLNNGLIFNTILCFFCLRKCLIDFGSLATSYAFKLSEVMNAGLRAW